MAAIGFGFRGSTRWGLVGLTVGLIVAALAPAKSEAAFATFSNGVLTVTASEGKIVPRCAGDGELTVSGLPPQGDPPYCRDLRRIEATSIVSGLFDFSQLPDDLGGGQGPIEIHASSRVDDPTEISDDKFIGAPGHVNVFDGGLGFDSMTGGNLDDRLNGGDESDKIDGGGGNDVLLGGAESDKIAGGSGNDILLGGAASDQLLGGPGRDTLKGGGGTDKLIGGPGKDVEKQ